MCFLKQMFGVNHLVSKSGDPLLVYEIFVTIYRTSDCHNDLYLRIRFL